MSVQVFPKLENLDLTEYAADSAFESYTGIVLDPEDKVFKTVSGQFHDKKDFYEKLSDRGYVVRKVFETRVFNWIEENAKTTLEAYLMFSTAFSKWKGNNLLDPYYVKLLNDIPQLNREKIKGDPNSIGTQKTEESVLDETWENMDIEGIDNWGKHKVSVIPVDDATNELEISSVRFDPAAKQVFETYRKLNRPTEFKKAVYKYLQTSPEFLRALGKEIDPVNRDVNHTFYDPTKDIRSPLYIQDSGKNPNKFYLKIDGNVLENIDGTPFILDKVTLMHWYRALGNLNQTVPEVNPQNILKLNKDALLQSRDEQLLTAAADLEKTIEILSNSEVNTNEIKKALYTLMSGDLKNIIRGGNWAKYVSQQDHDKAIEFKQDLQNFTNPKISADERKNLYKKYNAENQAVAINNLKKAEKEFYEKMTNKINIPDTLDDQIKWLKEYIDMVERTDLSDNYTKKERLDKLRSSLIKLQVLKNKPAPKAKDKLKTDYSHPDSSPVDAPRTGYIDQPKGAKAKHTTTQADLGVNKGIHSFGKESTWGNIINELKEDHIPVVDDIIHSIKHVNYNATQSYVNAPVNGVITSPGAVFNTGGTFFTEEEDPQWDNRAHEELNQDLFEGTHLRPEVREALLRIAGKFQNTLGLNIKPVDIYFTGSGANFNYNEMSDIDLHLVYDFEQIGINAEILVKYFIAKKQVFNNDYEITIKGMPVEVGVENVNEPIVSSAIYSVAKDQWMLEPKDAAHLLPKPDMKEYYKIVQQIEDAIESRNSQKIGDLWDELYRIRKQSLATDGEYGHGNGLFKKLRNLGYLDRLKHAYYSSASEELSLEALKDII